MADIIPATEFQALPIEFLIATPLIATVKAQAAAAQATLEFIKGLTDEDPATHVRTPQKVVFDLQYQETNPPAAPGGQPVTQEKHVHLDVPLLSIVPIPHLRIDSMTNHFKYEISQVVADKSAVSKGVDLSATAGTSLIPFISATLKGNLSSQSSQESTTNRSGVMEVTIHASEAPIPEGLARLLSLLAKIAEPKDQGPVGAPPAG